MYKPILIIILPILGIFLSGCREETPAEPALYPPDNQDIRYTGRIDFSNPQKPRLSGAGAYLQLKFKGTSCDILLEDENLYGSNHNYIVTVIDGKYQGRIKVSKDKTQYRVAENLEDTEHLLLVCKATEAQNGYIGFTGILCGEILPLEKSKLRKIEFIGGSITCGMGLEASELPEISGEWYDQHNAYLAYGPRLARELNAAWLLSSVSGMGISRNWNSPGPTLPEVYEYTYLKQDSPLAWKAQAYIPDLISICLGTNDFSDGDGSYERAELEREKFINAYIDFIKRLRGRYPQAQICLLTSSLLSREKHARLKEYLSEIISHMREQENDEKVHMFVFSRSYANDGRDGHPGKKDHQIMAEELLPFFKQIMDWK